MSNREKFSVEGSDSSVDVYQDAATNWRFSVHAGNKEIVMGSEAYASRANAVRGFQDLVSVLQDLIAIDLATRRTVKDHGDQD